jgi:hypothetical protein
LIESESELHGLRLTWFQGNPAEATKFLDRAGHGADFVSNVELHNFVAAHYAGVADFHGDFGFARNPDRGRRRPEYLNVVAQSPSERKGEQSGKRRTRFMRASKR